MSDLIAPIPIDFSALYANPVAQQAKVEAAAQVDREYREDALEEALLDEIFPRELPDPKIKLQELTTYRYFVDPEFMLGDRDSAILRRALDDEFNRLERHSKVLAWVNYPGAVGITHIFPCTYECQWLAIMDAAITEATQDAWERYNMGEGRQTQLWKLKNPDDHYLDHLGKWVHNSVPRWVDPALVRMRADDARKAEERKAAALNPPKVKTVAKNRKQRRSA
jgi:hypothetical protein